MGSKASSKNRPSTANLPSFFDPEKINASRMLAQEFGLSGGGKTRGQSRSSRASRPYSSGTSQINRQGPGFNAQYAFPGRSGGFRTVPRREAVHAPNINAVPAAKVSQSTQDWLFGEPSEKDNKGSPSTNNTAGQTTSGQTHKENAAPQTASQPAAPAKLDTKPQQQKPQQASTGQTSSSKPLHPRQTDLSSGRAGEPLKYTSTSAVGASAVTQASPATDVSQQNGQSQTTDGYGVGPTVANPGERKRRTVLEEYHLLLAKRATGRRAETPDLMDVDSPPPTPNNEIFDAEDVPSFLPAPLLPSESSRKGAMTLSEEEDLLEFADSRDSRDFGFGVLIPQMPADALVQEKPSGKANKDSNPTVSARPTTASTTGNGAKAATTVSIDMKLKAAAEAQLWNFANAENSIKSQGLPNSRWVATPSQQEGQSSAISTGDTTTTGSNNSVAKPEPSIKPEPRDCSGSTKVKSARGLASSKWADLGCHHQGQLPRKTEMPGHEVRCPALELAAKSTNGTNGGTVQVQPGESRPRQRPQFVWQPKSKRLSPYAFPFYPSEDLLLR